MGLRSKEVKVGARGAVGKAVGEREVGMEGWERFERKALRREELCTVTGNSSRMAEKVSWLLIRLWES